MDDVELAKGATHHQTLVTTSHYQLIHILALPVLMTLHILIHFRLLYQSLVYFKLEIKQDSMFKGESFRPGIKISSNYKDHTFEVFIYKYQQTPQLTGI